MLLGHARGKVGDIVFSRSNGQQVTRARAAVVKNPRTEIQLIQRILLNTISQAYSKLQPICDHSFEGVQVGQPSASRFMRVNLRSLRARVAEEIAAFTDLDSIVSFSKLGTNVFAPNTYVISSGTLPSVAVVPKSPASSLVMVADVFAAETPLTTYQDVISAAGLKRGDQLTFIAAKGSSVVEPTIVYSRIILDPVSDTGQHLPLSTPFLVDGAVNMPSPRNTGSFTAIALTSSGLEFNLGGNIPTLGAAVIVSRQKSDGAWQRSNSSLVLNEIAVLGEFPSLQSALDAAASSSISDISDLYLNNAGENVPVNTPGAAITRAFWNNNANSPEIGEFTFPWPAAGVVADASQYMDPTDPGAILVIGTGLNASTLEIDGFNGAIVPTFSADGTRAYTRSIGAEDGTVTIKLGGVVFGGSVNYETLRP